MAKRNTIQDFYMRSKEDPKYKNDILENSDELEEAIAQIRMTLLTEKGEVLGEPNFGIDVNKYLFDFEIDPFALSKQANAQLEIYVAASTTHNIEVKPAEYLDEKQRKVFVLGIGIEGIDPFAILYD